MDCASARRAMLEAEPAELEAGAASELGRHLEGCAACRSAAAHVLDTERRLGAWLADARPRGDADVAVIRAAALARRRATARRLVTGGSLLAAAAVATLLLLPHRQLPPATPIAAAHPEVARFAVTAPPGSDVIVMHTSNPKIVVVWYLPSRRTS